MRLHVVYDKNGKIIGGGVAMPEPQGRGPRSGALAHEGQHAAEFEIPAEHSGLTLHDLIEHLRVDVTGKEHKLVAKRS
jgi:hypothetical protein